MSSQRNYCLAGCLSSCILVILMSFSDAASFQYYQVPQQDQEYRMKTLQRLPSPDMLKALEYIENLRKQASRTESLPDYTSYQGAPFLSEQKDTQALSTDTAKSPTSDDESEWMRAMLEALMQAEKEAKVSPQEKNNLYMDKNIPPELIEDYDSNKWSEKRPKAGKFSSRLYDDYSRDNPLKRTNEIVEGQYTPQSLATLQSVFQELGKLKGQANNKRDRMEEDQKLYKDDEDDLYKANNIAYEDVAGGEDWNPIEEKVESQTQEELKESKEEVEKTDDMEDEIKRSGLLGLQDEEPEKDTKEQESENLSNLMNTYLNMWMNRMDKGKQNPDRRSLRFSGKELDPEAIYQLIDISRNLQIPPEDLIDMLRDEDGRKFGGRLESEKEVDVPLDLDEVTETMTDKTNVYKNKQGFVRQPTSPVLPNIPEGLTVEDMVNLMGADKLQNRFKQNNGLQRPYPMLSKIKGHKAIWPKESEKRQIEYESRPEKEEELADYVVKMLAKYPELLGNNQNKKMPIPYSAGDLQELEKQYENALRGYVNMRGYQDLETVSSSNRRLSTRENDDTQNKQYIDEDLLMKVLEYLNQEKAEKARDHSVKRSMENM
uniref:Secretogranin-2 n=1 Tax=Pelophylax ridibundus TaxID=8406 RepID=SCG2_PELRI|nr:RecName: Full=Secretogranin-2; AltName: Full=Secretogranin II; Short=SgII; Contains: RecName: Full=Secretoneurin; Short=SN; AltName: Full=Brain peptide; Flags: Precursor [Pelophylax ridibundus]AAB17470.1 secretogranin II [Pelophylax ridibundus]